MPRSIAEDYFRTGVWAARGPLRLRHYTCVVCGARRVTWEAFREHRAGCVPPGDDLDVITVLEPNLFVEGVTKLGGERSGA